MVGSGFDAPVFVTHAPGDTTRLFVVERPGRIAIIDTDGSNERELLDISDMVTSGSGSSETGMLGLAFHPDFPSDPRFYVNYTTSGAGGLTTRIATYEVSASDDEQVEGGESELFSFGQPQPNHNGGMLAFGHDGCLYVGTGDGGGANDTFTMPCAGGNGQCLDTPLGKILRIDVDAPDMAAPGNLDGGHRHIWDYGIRNPWRFSFDRDTGDLYIGDVGQGAIEEVDVSPRGVGNINWGWRIAEGSECRGGGGGCDMTGLEPPTDEYANVGADDCVIGGYVYRGAAIPDLQGWYLYGDNGSNRIHSFVWDGAGRCGANTVELTSDLSISGDLTSFGEDGNGELYMTTLSGNLYRIEAQ
jgi:glucose/arabinose dehydrogenase